MPRVSRVVLAGVPFHVTQRGNRRSQVFFSDQNREIYLEWLREYAERCSVDILAYCLMINHVHLVLVPSTSQGLHRMLKPLHTRYAQNVNRAMGWKGHLWQGRFFSSALDETYLWAAVRYVERNPVRAKITDRAEDYRWSSAAGHCGLTCDPVLTQDSHWQRQFAGIGDWSAWLARGDEQAGLDTLRRNVQAGIPCGSSSFVEALESDLGRPLRCQLQGRAKASRA
jgi:putative transposase